MRPILFNLGPIHVYGYGLMIALGCIAALVLFAKRAPKYGLKPDFGINILVVGLIAGFLGAKILYLITVLPSFISNPAQYIRNFSDGFVVYGGLIGALACEILYLHHKKMSFREYFDLTAPSIAIAQAFGRLGCFMAGCCYGRETTSAIGVTFPADSIAPSGVTLLPTQLFSCGLDVLNCILLIVFASRFKKKDGQVGCLYLIAYSVGRFFLEFFRGDAERGTVGALSTSQFISILMFVLSVALFVAATRAKESRYKTC